MSRFTKLLDVRQQSTDWRDWQLLQPLPYEAGTKGFGRWIGVRAGGWAYLKDAPKPIGLTIDPEPIPTSNAN